MTERDFFKAMEKKSRIRNRIVEVVFLVAAVIGVFVYLNFFGPGAAPHAMDITDIPPYEKYSYVIINNDEPLFDASEMVTQSYEFYSELDALGRCGYAMACVGRDLMPTEDRENISSIKPSGWVQAQYDIVEGNNLYNRCHLIGFQLTGENANERNLITGTQFLNTKCMLPYENLIADYVKETGNHVLYRVTPIYEGDNLVASGVQVEGWSVEDHGESISFHTYLYNVQPGVIIDYATGESRLDPDYSAQ